MAGQDPRAAAAALSTVGSEKAHCSVKKPWPYSKSQSTCPDPAANASLKKKMMKRGENSKIKSDSFVFTDSVQY